MFGLCGDDVTRRLIDINYTEVHCMAESLTIGVSKRQTKRLRLLAILGITATVGMTSGCHTMRQRGVFSDPTTVTVEPSTNVPSATQSLDSPENTRKPLDVDPVSYSDEVSVAPNNEMVPGSSAADPAVSAAAPTRTFNTPPDTLTSFSDLIAMNSTLVAIGAATAITEGIDPGVDQSGGLTLESIESIALANNPTIAELVATTQKAAGFKTQVGLRANPTIGYSGNQLADAKTDQHTAYISQTIITADKLALNRQVLNETLRAQLLRLEAQKYRVATDIRITFYAALAAQRRLSLIRDFQSVADKGLELAELRKKGQEGSQLDVVQAQVQKFEIDLLLQQSEVRYHAAWRELAALAGRPELEPVPLVGLLPTEPSDLDWQEVASVMVVSSPEYRAAQAVVSQARANITRQDVQKIPNLNVNLGAGSDQATGTGLINLAVGVPIPLFNKNQGNISAALAEYVRACREVERVQNSIRLRLAVVSSDYGSSSVAVQRYSQQILPNAAESLKLAEIAYRAGETSFVQVLVARRTYFDTNLEYLSAQTVLAQSRARVDGYVLTGGLDPIVDDSGNSGLRDQAFSQD